MEKPGILKYQVNPRFFSEKLGSCHPCARCNACQHSKSAPHWSPRTPCTTSWSSWASWLASEGFLCHFEGVGKVWEHSGSCWGCQPCEFFVFLDFLDFSLNLHAREKVQNFWRDNDLIDFSRKYDFVPKDAANCDSAANSGQFGKPSYSIFHPTTSFWDAETIQEKSWGRLDV